MKDKLISNLLSISSQPAIRVSKELESFYKLTESDFEMACVRARRCSDLIARYIYSQKIGEPGLRPLEEILEGLQRVGLISRVHGIHFSTVKELGEIASEKAMQLDINNEIRKEEVEECKMALNAIVEWFLNFARGSKSLEMIENTYVVPDLEITLDDIYGTVEVDKDVYSTCETTYVPSCDLVASWFHLNPDIYTIIKDRQSSEVIGYINAMPIYDDAFREIFSGKFEERELGFSEIRRYEIPDLYRLYFCSIALMKSRRTVNNLRKLLEGFLSKIWRFAHQDIYIREIVADATTKEGYQMCNSVGMKPVAKTKRDTTIYYVSLLPPEFRVLTKNGMALREHYTRVYSRLKAFIDITNIST